MFVLSQCLSCGDARWAHWKLACLVGQQPEEGQCSAKLCSSTETAALGPYEAYALRNQESLLHQLHKRWAACPWLVIRY